MSGVTDMQGREGGPRTGGIVSFLMERSDLVAVAVFAVFVGVIRLPYLGHLGFWSDEAISVLAAEGVLKQGYPVLPSGVFYGHGPLFSYLMAFSFMVFGTSEFSARVVSLIFGSLTLPVIYFLGRDLGDKRAGIIGMAVVAFSPWAVAWARQARMYTEFQFFYLLTVYVLYRNYVAAGDGVKRPRKYLILLGVLFLGAFFSQEFALTIIPSFITYLLITRGIRWIKYRYFVIGVAAVALLILFFWGSRFRPLGVGLPEFTFGLGWLRYNFLRSYVPFQMRYPILSLFVVMGTSILLLKRDKKFLFLYVNLLVPLNFVPVIVSGISLEVYDRYLFFLLPIFALASAFSLLKHTDSLSKIVAEKIGNITKQLTRKKLEKVTAALLVSIVVFPVISSVDVYILFPDSSISVGEAFSYYQPEHQDPWIDIEYEFVLRGFRVASEFVEQGYQAGDAVVSTQHVPTYYYLKNNVLENNVTLFYLRQRRATGLVEDQYLNSTTIDILNELKEVLFVYNRVWIIVDEQFVRVYAQPSEIIDFIYENTELVYENEEDHVQVYLWSL